MAIIYTQGFYSRFMREWTYCRLDKPPRFVPAHEQHGSKNLPNGKTVNQWMEPDTVRGFKGSFQIKRGVVDAIRQSEDPNVVATFAEIDAERERLNAALAALAEKERKAIIGTFNCSKPVKVADLKAMEAAKGAGTIPS